MIQTNHNMIEWVVDLAIFSRRINNIIIIWFAQVVDNMKGLSKCLGSVFKHGGHMNTTISTTISFDILIWFDLSLTLIPPDVLADPRQHVLTTAISLGGNSSVE